MATPTHPETPAAYSNGTSPPRDERPGTDASAAEIEADIARTREQLGHTVEALSDKLDVKSRAQDKLQAAKHGAVEQTRIIQARGRQYAAGSMAALSDDEGKTKPVVPATGAALAAMGVAAIVMVVWRRSQ